MNKLDWNKLRTVPIDAIKLSNIVERDVVRKIEYEQLVKKLIRLIQTNKILKKAIDNVDKKVTIASKFSAIQDFGGKTSL